MASIVEKLADKKIISAPAFIKGSIQFEATMGSQAYGCASDHSDCDIYGFCIPPKAYTFPHTAGEIWNFSTPKFRFDQLETKKPVVYEGTEYDVKIYNIIKFFKLAMDCSPNIIDTLFVPERCVLHISEVGKIVRQNRELFLSKKLYHTMCGYAHSQLHKIKTKTPDPGSKRAALVEEFKFDVKFAYHVVRIMLECEQALTLGTINLERDRELYKAIRRGEWSQDRVENFLIEKEDALRRIYDDPKCPLAYKSDEDRITQVLMNCLEEFYGSLSNCIVVPDALDKMSDEILEVVHRYTGRR